MKKIGITLAICTMLFSANTLAQEKNMPFLLKESIKNNTVKLKSGLTGSYPQHTVEYNWVTDWVLFRTVETSYFPFGEPASIEYTTNGNKTRNLFSYNDQHDQTEVISQVFVDGSWMNQSRDITTYYSNRFPQEMRTEQWNGTDWVLQNGFQITLEMDGNRVKVMTYKNWNDTTLVWKNSMRETYSYPATGQNYTSVISETWDNAWVYILKKEYTWANNRVSESLNYSYSGADWVLTGKNTYEYQDNGSHVTTTYLSLGPGQWLAMQRFTYLFDSHGNATLYQTEMYSILNVWTIFSATSFELTYSGNNLTQRITRNYSSGWNNVRKEVFSNFASLSTDVSLLSPTGLNIFPNPAGKQAVVRLSMLKAGAVTLSVYSITGQKILEETFTTGGSDVNLQLNLDKVRPGSYILMAHDKQGNEIGKTRLIKQ
ncbi:MAG: T9SS type A sorting domain-containing protein [Bacteroidia bacterium]|nr:T9SS type A sorting domain-containing protein [Bacteroidia bacterium]